MVNAKQFGPFEILRKLGRGMTDVYLAFDTSHNRRVVLKIVEESADSAIIVEAEQRGAALQKQLHEFDSRFLEIYDYGLTEGCFYVAMQFIEGRNVADILRAEKRIEPLRAARIAHEIAGQLDRLHSYLADIDGQRRAVVHGDIKPSNIQIGLNDEVRLLDFGIAKAITFTHNRTHHTFGSPSYCSPERLSRAQVDPQADLWALGVTLFEMVAGAPPYQAQSTRKLESLIQSRRPPRALASDCPTALRAIIIKALAGDQHQRYVSAAAFRDDLQLFLQNRPTVSERESRTAWNASATLEKSKPPSVDGETIDRPVLTPRPRKLDGALRLLGALLWGLLAGLLVFGSLGFLYVQSRHAAPLRANLGQIHRTAAEIDADWDDYEKLRKRSDYLGRLSPVADLGPKLRASYIAAADEIIDRYRNSSDPALQDFDWQKAIVCLQHVLVLDGRDHAAQGRLAIAMGYQALVQTPPREDSAKAEFDQAVTLMPRSPDPHLGLARMQIYVYKNVGRAIAELREAERLGFAPGPREMEQEADGYRFRAVQELEAAKKLTAKARDQQARYLQLAQRDFDRARRLYEPIQGFSNVGFALQQVDNDDRNRQQLDNLLHKPSPPARKRYRALWGRRRWQ